MSRADAEQLLWVLGHKIRRWDTDQSYGLVEVTSPSKVLGPPPHYHKREQEFFLILKGTLDVMIQGNWKVMRAGSFVELPPNTIHTFMNSTEQETVWISGWRPKGFQEFFRAFGIAGDGEAAREQSMSREVIKRAGRECELYGMFIG